MNTDLPREGRRSPRPPATRSRHAGERVRLDPTRETALHLLVDHELEQFPLGPRLEREEQRLERPEDRRLLRALVVESIRHRSRLDWVLAHFLERGGPARLTPWIRNLLRMALAQLVVIGLPPHAVVHTAVSLARRYGHAGTAALVNALLRRAEREGQALFSSAAPGLSPEDLATRCSMPHWIVRRWIERWGLERARAALEFSQRVPDYWVRLRPGAAAPPESTPGWIPGTARFPAGARPAERAEFAAGHYSIQDGAAILVGHLPPAVAGRVWDACAAPGTKSGHLRERMEPGTRILATDLSRGRLERMRRDLPRTAADLDLVACDGRRPPFGSGFDGILLDAPCSNLGVLRRRVDARWRTTEAGIPALAAVQAELLRAAAALAAPGGWVVYSVCTTEPEETTDRYDAFFRENVNFAPFPLPDFIPLGARGREGELLLVPGEHDTDGGYAFLARRRGGGPA